MRILVVGSGHARPLWAGHPWVHAAAIVEETQNDLPAPADVAEVRDERGRPIGWGLVSDTSALRVRLVGRGPMREPAEDLLRTRLEVACALRRRLFPSASRTNAYRLVHAEGDGLPGLVVDRYGDVLVAQFATAPMHRRREPLAEALVRATGARSLVARPGGYEREEGIPEAEAAFAYGETVPGEVEVREEGMPLVVAPEAGQKTGHYTDQRDNRVHVARLAGGRDVLDLFAGTGGFAVQALRHGARHATAVEASARALAHARRHAQLSGVEGALETVEGDVRHQLTDMRAAARTYDVVVCDPPNFFPKRGRAGVTTKAYRELNVRALTRVAHGGVFATFTCSARLEAAAWRELVVSAARECRRSLRILRELSAGPDHPVLGAAPEGRYLSGLLAVVDA